MKPMMLMPNKLSRPSHLTLPGALLLLLLSFVTIPQAIALPSAPTSSPLPPRLSDRAVPGITPPGGALDTVNNSETDAEEIPEDIPEEILRTELIVDGRSPLDGQLLSPEQYAVLQQQLTQKQNGILPVDSELQSLVFQLKLLNLLKTILPVF